MKHFLKNQEDTVVYRQGQGIKMVNVKDYDGSRSKRTTMASLKLLPVNTYFVAPDSSILDANETTAKTLNMLSVTDTIGRTPFDIFKKDSALTHRNTDKHVIHGKNFACIEETSIRVDNTFLYGISLKLPIFNEKNKSIGLLGFSIPFGSHKITDLMKSLAAIAETKLIYFPEDFLKSNSNIGRIVDEKYMTKRENEILYHLIRGKSVPYTARLLEISHRTVEQHVENLKNKFGVFSKAELIELFIDKNNSAY